MEYLKLVKVYSELEKTTKRLEKTKIISDFIKHVKKEELSHLIYLLQGNVFPKSDERKIGMSSRLILKVLSKSTGYSSDKIEDEWKKEGDLGLVAEKLIHDKMQRTLASKELTTEKVFDNIRKLAELEGKGTVDKKISLVSELVNNAKPEEAKFIIRTVLEEMRIGVAEGIIRDAIASAFELEPKEIEKTAHLLGDYGETAELAKQGKKELTKVKLKPGRPFRVMLALKADSFKELFDALGEKIEIEEKLDGFRCIIHNDGKEIKLYTRRLENVKNQFKEIILTIKNQIKGDSYIIDSELVGYDPKTKNYLPFQKISQRIKRKYDIESIAKKFPVEIKAFDIIYYNGKSIEDEPLLKRRELLEKVIKPKKFEIGVTKAIITSSEKEAEKFFKETLKKGMEGIIAKKIDSIYKPGRYVKGWVKLKPVQDTLDLVITGAQWGEGKRSHWLSSFILSCKKGKDYVSIGKVGTGIKEKEGELTFKELTKKLKPYITETKGKNVDIKPKIIIEVAYEEIQKSPTYDSGYALRFPRVKMIREDKPLTEVTTFEEIEKLYVKQKK